MSRAKPSTLLGLGLVIAASSGASIARADATADAKDLFARGRELRTNGDCAGALPLFHKAYDIYPAGLGSMRNIAECEESLGHFASARRAWLELGRALIDHASPRYAGWADDARQAAARLEPKVAELTVQVSAPTGGAPPPNGAAVSVTVNGEPLPASLLGTPLERDPARYDVAWSGPGVRAGHEEVVLTAGESRHVWIDAAPAPVDVARPPAAEGGRWQRTAGWAAIGVGVAGLIGTGISLAVFQNDHDQVATACPNFVCTSKEAKTRVQGAASEGATAATLVNVFAVVGAVGVAGGLVLLTTSHHTPAATTTALVLSPTGAAVTGSF